MSIITSSKARRGENGSLPYCVRKNHEIKDIEI